MAIKDFMKLVRVVHGLIYWVHNFLCSIDIQVLCMDKKSIMTHWSEHF